jgi:hypothetical protein
MTSNTTHCTMLGTMAMTGTVETAGALFLTGILHRTIWDN